MAGEGAHEAPACAVAGREHLQASEAVEEQGDGAEVGVFAQRRPPVVDGLRGGLEEANVIARVLPQSVQVLQRRWWQTQVRVQVREEEGDDGVGRADEGVQQVSTGREDAGGGEGRGEREDVVFGDVVQFVAVKGAFLVNDGGAVAFVAASSFNPVLG